MCLTGKASNPTKPNIVSRGKDLWVLEERRGREHVCPDQRLCGHIGGNGEIIAAGIFTISVGRWQDFPYRWKVHCAQPWS